MVSWQNAPSATWVGPSGSASDSIDIADVWPPGISIRGGGAFPQSFISPVSVRRLQARRTFSQTPWLVASASLSTRGSHSYLHHLHCSRIRHVRSMGLPSA